MKRGTALTLLCVSLFVAFAAGKVHPEKKNALKVSQIESCFRHHRAADLTDCTRYWVCESGTIALKKCPSGKSFNKALKTCDRTDAECADTRKKRQATEDADLKKEEEEEEEEKKKELKDHKEEKSDEQKHLEEQQKKELEEKKEHEKEEEEDEDEEDEEDDSDDDETTDDSDSSDDSSSDDDSDSSDSDDEERKPFRCPTLFGYYRHRDCNKFYQCNWGDAHVKRCRPNTQWNQKHKTCVHATTCKRSN